jgi:hypothetical protein
VQEVVSSEGRHGLEALIGLLKETLGEAEWIRLAASAEEFSLPVARGFLRGIPAAPGTAPSSTRHGGRVRSLALLLAGRASLDQGRLSIIGTRLIGELGSAAGADCRSHNRDVEDCLAQRDLIPVFEIVLQERKLGHLVGRQVPMTLADLGTVDIGAVAAAEVTDADLRRIDVEQAVMARDEAVVGVAGEAHLAILRPADEAGGALIEYKLLTAEFALGDLEEDLGRHRGLTGLAGGSD